MIAWIAGGTMAARCFPKRWRHLLPFRFGYVQGAGRKARHQRTFAPEGEGRGIGLHRGGQLVLTDQGCVPIEQVTPDMKLWDGVGWVHHDGVVCNGTKEVLTYAGLTATRRPHRLGRNCRGGAAGTLWIRRRLPAHISYKPEMVGKQYGWVEVISPEKRWNQKWNHCYVLTRCRGCGAVQWQNLSNLRGGKSKGCQTCSQPRTVPHWLERRFTAAKQRCTNPNDGNYQNYGARGIKFAFRTRQRRASTCRKVWLTRSRTGDRPNKRQWNYEPGNLRWVTHQENCQNQRRYLER